MKFCSELDNFGFNQSIKILILNNFKGKKMAVLLSMKTYDFKIS